MAAKRDADAKKADTPLIQIDDSKKGAAPAAPARRGHLFAGIASAACIVLIVVSLGFVHTAEGGAWSLAWIAESFQSGGVSQGSAGSVAQDGSAPSSKDSGKNSTSQKGDGSAGASEDAQDSAKDSKGDSSDKSKNEGSLSKKNSKKGSSSSASSGSSQGGGSASAGAGAASEGGTSAGGAGASGGSSSSGDSSAGGSSQDDGLITISVSVTSSAVGNPVSAGGTYTFKQGATVYDALCALGLSVNAHGSAYGTYVAAIGGLAEKEHGGSSGWMYSVNGSTPMVACSGYTLSDGDNVVWYYVTG